MWVGTSTDIQDQKTFSNELEQQVNERTRELEQKNADLVKMNAELETFAYVASHDLQEPLRKIQSFASLIDENENQSLSEKGKDYFRRMQAAAARMNRLIEDLLTYSRTATGERNFTDTDLNEILEEVKNDLKESLAEKNAVIEAAHLCRANIIPFQFRQLLNNLLGNSLKFSKKGEAPHIIITSTIVTGNNVNITLPEPEKNYCHISVADNGIGFEPRYKERIFELFQRLYGKSEYSGTGIGLAIVKKIVENHKGVIIASGELDKGARFDIYIPVHQ
jgi:light-regulated signal transduction histidine kinase (bacteriophytochrome)